MIHFNELRRAAIELIRIRSNTDSHRHTESEAVVNAENISSSF